MAQINNYITYVEFKAHDLEAIKRFYKQVFQWEFKDFGSDYAAFSGSGIAGGFERSDSTRCKGALVVIYYDDLEFIQKRILSNGGLIVREIFSFPGGQRFHFTDVAGNELAVWSDKEV